MAQNQYGYIGIDVPENTLLTAQEMRAERDKQYQNLYTAEDTDLRWIGEVGEICFDQWCPLPHEWLLGETAGRADFIVNGSTVGVKTVKRQVSMQPHYTAQISARHVNEPVEFYFFTCYQVPIRRLWLLGGITKANFITDAAHYRAGDQVHANYTIRPGHEIFNIEVKYLTPPDEWIESLPNEQNG